MKSIEQKSLLATLSLIPAYAWYANRANRDLEKAVAERRFREDLYYRLNVFPVEVAPLRDRGTDIPLLVKYFFDRYARKMGKEFRRTRKGTLDRLKSYSWPANVNAMGI